MSIETQGLTLKDTTLVQTLAKGNAMLREMKSRKEMFSSMDTMMLTVLGARVDTRMELEAKREAMFAKTEGWADNDPNGYDEVIIGGGPTAATWAASAVLMERPRPLVITDVFGGQPFAATVNPWFRANSRNRPGEAGLSGEDAALNVIPYAPIQGENLNMDEFQTNSELAFVTRTSLIRNADLRKGRAVAVDLARSTSSRRYKVRLEDGTVYADRVIDARGLGEPTEFGVRNERVWSVYDFAKRFDEPFPLRGLKRVAVIGGGDSGKVVVEALLGIGPNQHMSIPMLDWVEQIDWYAENLPTDCFDWRSSIRGRYQDIGSFLRRPAEGRSRLRVFDQRGYPDPGVDKVYVAGRAYDAVVYCGGFERLRPLDGLVSDYGDTLVMGSDGFTPLGRQTADGGAAYYQVGVAARLPFDSADPESTTRIANNQVALFRNLPRVVQLSARMKPINPELVVADAKSQRARAKVVGYDRNGNQIKIGDRVRNVSSITESTLWAGEVVSSGTPSFPFAIQREDGVEGGGPNGSFLVNDGEGLELAPRRGSSRFRQEPVKPIIGYDANGRNLREGDRVFFIDYDGNEITGSVTADPEGPDDGYRLDYAVLRDDGALGGGPKGSYRIEDEDSDPERFE